MKNRLFFTRFYSVKQAFIDHKVLVFFFIIILLAFSLRVWNLGKAGQVWDEKSLLVDYSYQYYEDFINLDFGDDYWWKGTPDHPPLVRYMRVLASLPDIEGFKDGKPVYSYDMIHNRMLSVVLTTLAAGLVFLIGFRYISLSTGIAAGMIFAMMPIPLAHSQIAMLEALALFFFTASMFSFLLFLEKPTKKRALLAGVALGLAILSRETHLMLIPMMLLIFFIKNIGIKKKDNRRVFFKILLIFLVSFLTFFAFWPMPFFHLDYIYQYTMALRFQTHLSIPEVFFGRLMLVPIPYYVVYFLITTPLIILLLFFSGLQKMIRSKNWVWYSFIIWFVFPFIMSFYHERQQGIRYIIQICVPLALIAGFSFTKLTDFITQKKTLKIVGFILLFLYQFIILWRITPYYLDYFNILVGGSQGVYEKRLFQLAWWGEGLKEAVDYINEQAPDGATIGIATSPDHILEKMPGKKVVKYTDNKVYDYVIVNFYNITREKFDDSKIRQNYKVIYSVNADGANLVQVYKRK